VTLNERVPIAGIAFAGDRGISKVSVSNDSGNTGKLPESKIGCHSILGSYGL